ncbi:MAG: galactose oxidase early set domain-containing protein [Solirubrobacteraceae bacterium]
MFGDSKDTTPGFFETRIEIYSPPYLYHGARPKISAGPRQLSRGGTYSFTTPNTSAIAGARLLAPSAVTHVTNTDQRSIELSVVHEKRSFRVTIPTSFGLLPSEWYMLFVTNAENTPSTAYWVHVS